MSSFSHAHGRTSQNTNLSSGYKKAIELLIEKGSNVNAVQNERKLSPLHLIAALNISFSGHDNWTEDDRLSNFNFI